MDPTDACSRCITRNDCAFVNLPRKSPVTGKPLVHERHFQRGEMLREQGAASDTVQMIKVGNVLASRSGVDDRPRPVFIICPGQTVGQFEPTEAGNTLSCRAISAGRLCEVLLGEIGEAATEDFRNVLLERNTRTFRLLADWAQIMRIKGVTGQVAAALVQLASSQRVGNVVHLPGHSALAELLGTSRETIARVLAQLELKGALARLDRTHCTINRSKLVALLAG